MKQPITSSLIIIATASVLAYSSYRLNRYCAIIPAGKLGCRIFCKTITTAPQTITMRMVLKNHEVLALMLGRKLGYI